MVHGTAGRSKAPDRRMLWIRDLDAAAAGDRAETWEVELGSEVEVTGQLDYADGAIIMGQLTSRPDPSGLYKLVLRMKLPPSERDMETEAARTGTKGGYLFRPGPFGELAALMSL